MTQNQIELNHITTDDLAFAAFLRMRRFPIIKVDHDKLKSIFTFDLKNQNAHQMKMEFVNSEFLIYYNELRNMKKLIL